MYKIPVIEDRRLETFKRANFELVSDISSVINNFSFDFSLVNWTKLKDLVVSDVGGMVGLSFLVSQATANLLLAQIAFIKLKAIVLNLPLDVTAELS